MQRNINKDLEVFSTFIGYGIPKPDKSATKFAPAL